MWKVGKGLKLIIMVSVLFYITKTWHFSSGVYTFYIQCISLVSMKCVSVIWMCSEHASSSGPIELPIDNGLGQIFTGCTCPWSSARLVDPKTDGPHCKYKDYQHVNAVTLYSFTFIQCFYPKQITVQRRVIIYLCVLLRCSELFSTSIWFTDTLHRLATKIAPTNYFFNNLHCLKCILNAFSNVEM